MILAILLVCGFMVNRANAVSNSNTSFQSMDSDAVLQWLEKYSPSIASDLAIIQPIAPDVYMEVVEDAAMEIPEGEELRQTDPELFAYFMVTDELEVRSIRLAVQLAVEKDAAKQKAMKDEIKSLVQQIFEQRLEQHQLIVDEIERELKALKKMGKVRKENQEKVIRQRYEYLTNPDSEALEWW